MCGICGIVGEKAKHNLSWQEIVPTMIDAMRHRGPDDEGYYVDEEAVLGFCRLSIIDLPGGRQPLADEEGRYWLVFNGEIYNFAELRRELASKGHRFATATDGEVILHLYQEYGPALLSWLRGMFAFAIYDRVKKTLFAARDPFGIKPFYYARRGRSLYFASELKALLAAGLSGETDPGALYHYLTLQYIPDPLTPFREIRRLPPAHYLFFDGRELKIRRYWQAEFSPNQAGIEEHCQRLRQVLTDSIKHHAISHVPVGAFLSSGVDSAAAVALLKEFYGEVLTFSVGFAGDGYEEHRLAAATAAKLGVRNRCHVITREEYFRVLPEVIWHLDEPLADPSVVPLYILSHLAREEVKVVLSGEGADEIFAGYNIYLEPRALRWARYLPFGLRRRGRSLLEKLPPQRGRNYLLRAFTPLAERYYGNACLFREEEKRKLLRPEFLREVVPTSSLIAAVTGVPVDDDYLTWMQLVDINFWLPGDILAKADRMSMAHGLELRVPYLDPEVFKVACQIPPAWRTYRGKTKYVFRRAVQDLLPPETVARKKLGFPVPLRRWLDSPLGRELEATIGESELVRDLFSPGVLASLWQQHRAGQRNLTRQLWALYVLALWWEICCRGSWRFGEKKNILAKFVPTIDRDRQLHYNPY